MCLFHDQVVVHHIPQTALLVSLQYALPDWIISFEEGFSILLLLYKSGKRFSKDFLNMPIFFLERVL